MRVTVVGPGGVGGYLAARIAASGTAEVGVVARGRHLEGIRRDGLRLESPHGDLHTAVAATDDPAEIGPVDVVLLTVKDTDTAEATARLGPLLGDETVVVTFQNGVDSPDRVAAQLGEHRVLAGIAYIFSTVASPGVVRHTAGPGRFVVGARQPGMHDRAAQVGAVLADAGVQVEVVEDVAAAQWTKFAVICATAGGTACSRLPIDELREDPFARQLLRDLATEVVAVGQASGVALPHETVDRTMAFVDTVGPDAYSSLLYDLQHGKPMELDTLHGAIVRRAERLGVDVPVCRTVYAMLSPWARRNLAGTGGRAPRG